MTVTQVSVPHAGVEPKWSTTTMKTQKKTLLDKPNAKVFLAYDENEHVIGVFTNPDAICNQPNAARTEKRYVHSTAQPDKVFIL